MVSSIRERKWRTFLCWLLFFVSSLHTKLLPFPFATTHLTSIQTRVCSITHYAPWLPSTLTGNVQKSRAPFSSYCTIFQPYNKLENDGDDGQKKKVDDYDADDDYNHLALMWVLMMTWARLLKVACCFIFLCLHTASLLFIQPIYIVDSFISLPFFSHFLRKRPRRLGVYH